MDLQLAATLSLSETVIWARLSEASLQTSYWSIITQVLLYFALRYSALKAYRLIIYPNFVSPYGISEDRKTATHSWGNSHAS